jgi:hypothetical protein
VKLEAGATRLALSDEDPPTPPDEISVSPAPLALLSSPDARLHGSSTKRLRLPLSVDCARDKPATSPYNTESAASTCGVSTAVPLPIPKRRNPPTPPKWSSKCRALLVVPITRSGCCILIEQMLTCRQLHRRGGTLRAHMPATRIDIRDVGRDTDCDTRSAANIRNMSVIAHGKRPERTPRLHEEHTAD